MNELEVMQLKFEQVYKDRPSAIRTTLLYGPIGWITRIIGWLLFIVGVGLIIATGMGNYLFSLTDTDKQISSDLEAYEQLVLLIQITIGISVLIIGTGLITIGSLCRKIVIRNVYILDLEELFHFKDKKIH